MFCREMRFMMDLASNAMSMKIVENKAGNA